MFLPAASQFLNSIPKVPGKPFSVLVLYTSPSAPVSANRGRSIRDAVVGVHQPACVQYPTTSLI